MKISFCFQGWVSDAEVKNVIDNESGNEVDIKKVGIKKLVERLNSGKYSINLASYLNEDGNFEIELHDFEGK